MSPGAEKVFREALALSEEERGEARLVDTREHLESLRQKYAAG
ncbi:MAG: hypothetical protein P1V51_13235 [Deltaproteobacteria bacterium]|nr:hypothetical protein [Deltaproteobacteria bacterium]